MILKNIYLYLNNEMYPKYIVTKFGFQTRYMCNFLERKLKKLKFKSEGFSKICVQGNPGPKEECPIVSENAAVPTVSFDSDKYLSLSKEGLHKYFFEMLNEGMGKCSRYHNFPLNELIASLEEFRTGGYVNHWVHKSKNLRGLDLKSVLHCELNMDEFSLFLKLEKKGQVIFEEKILETKPDELIFAHKFKEVKFDSESIVVLDRFGGTVFSKKIDELTV